MIDELSQSVSRLAIQRDLRFGGDLTGGDLL
jgi:hypothetical protein